MMLHHAASLCAMGATYFNIYSCYPSMQASKQFIKQRTRENPNTLDNDCTCPRNAPQRGWLSGHLQQIGQGLSSKSQIDLQHVWEHRSKLAYDAYPCVQRLIWTSVVSMILITTASVQGSVSTTGKKYNESVSINHFGLIVMIDQHMRNRRFSCLPARQCT